MNPKQTAKYKGSNRSQLPDDVEFPVAVKTPLIHTGPGYTTTQKNALTGMVEGDEIWDKTLHKKCVYSGTAWETVTSA